MRSDSPVLKAVWAHCIECSGGVKKDVRACVVKGCHLYPWRDVSASLETAEKTLEGKRRGNSEFRIKN